MKDKLYRNQQGVYLYLFKWVDGGFNHVQFGLGDVYVFFSYICGKYKNVSS